MLKVWGRRNSINVQKVMWTIGELGLEHEHIDAGGRFGGLDTAEFAARNPNRHVPVIDDGGTVVWESQAIVRYLAAKYGAGTIWPKDPGTRARLDMWTDWNSNELQPVVMGVFRSLWRTPQNQRNPQLIRRLVVRSGQLFGLLERHLEGQLFVGGATLTFGDIPAGTQLYRYFTLPIQRPPLPYVEAWYARLQEREAYRTHVMVSYEELKGQPGTGVRRPAPAPAGGAAKH